MLQRKRFICFQNYQHIVFVFNPKAPCADHIRGYSGQELVLAQPSDDSQRSLFVRQKNDTNNDVYDLASLTKILASLPLLMKAEEEQKINLNEKLQDLLPSFKGSNKASVSVRETLSHFGKLKAWIPFYKGTQDTVTHKNLPIFYRKEKLKNYSVKVAQNLYLKNSYKDSIYKHIREAEQREEAGYKYSDLGYYIFKEALEREYNKPLNTLVDKNIYQPLGANRTSYLPLQKFPKDEIVPTENDDYYRNQLLHGDVHDMGAAMLGGVGVHIYIYIYMYI